MKQIEIDCWQVKESDGCGVGSIHLCYCSSKAIAEEIANRNPHWRYV